MTKLQRVKNFIMGFLLLLWAALLIIDPKDGYVWVLIIMDILLVLQAIRGLTYYFSLARFMVDGRRVLYKTLFILDLAIFANFLVNIPSGMLVIYITYIVGFAGVVSIFNAFQALKIKSKAWVKKLIYGIVEFGICVLSIRFIKNMEVMAYVYAAVIIYLAITKIADAFKKSAIMYVQ